MRVIDRKLVRTEPAGYEVWSETYQMGDIVAKEMGENTEPQSQEVSDLIEVFESGSGRINTHEVTYTPNGHYIGNEKTAKFLCEEKGIAPEPLKSSESKVCSIGFCEKDQKWFGWSHRAIYGFAVGDVVKEGDCTASSGWTADHLAEHPEADLSLPVGFKAESMEDARRMAVAFAESVG